MASDDGLLRRTEAAISAQLPADNGAATKVLNAVVSVTEAIHDLDPPERQRTLGIVGGLLFTVETGDDLDEVYGQLDRLLQKLRAASAESQSIAQPDQAEAPLSRRTTTSQG